MFGYSCFPYSLKYLKQAELLYRREDFKDAFSDQILTYEWSPDYGLNSNNSSEVIATPLVPTHYDVIVTDINNCFEMTYSF